MPKRHMQSYVVLVSVFFLKETPYLFPELHCTVNIIVLFLNICCQLFPISLGTFCSVCFLFMICFYNLITVSPPSSHPNPCSYLLHAPLSPSTSSKFLFRKGQASSGYQPDGAHQAAVDQALSLILGLDKATQYEKQGPKFSQRNQTWPLLPLLGVPQENQATPL